MDTSRKSYRSFSLAQSIKKQIDDTLFKVELEKRKFLTIEREEQHFQDSLDKKMQLLKQLKAKEADTKLKANKTGQTSNIIGHVDRNNLLLTDSIQHLRKDITLHRRQISKFKALGQRLSSQIKELEENNQKVNTQNAELEQLNEGLKEDILRLRENNIKNAGQFYQSFANISKADANQQNSRKKFSVSQKNFLGEEFKNSKIIPLDGLSQALRQSGIKFSDHCDEIMTDALPLAKERIRTKIHKNKEKLKISEAYKKFGEALQEMFAVMKQYKGRDDLDFIAQEFVTKERQLQKIEQYISQLESRILRAQLGLQNSKKQDQHLRQEVNNRVEKEDRHYASLQTSIQSQIESLKKQEKSFYEWFSKVSSILLPLTQEPLSRGNASNLIGQVEQQLGLARQNIEKKQPAKVTAPSFDQLEGKQVHNQLLSYEKMRELAAEYVHSKK